MGGFTVQIRCICSWLFCCRWTWIRCHWVCILMHCCSSWSVVIGSIVVGSVVVASVVFGSGSIVDGSGSWCIVVDHSSLFGYQGYFWVKTHRCRLALGGRKAWRDDATLRNSKLAQNADQSRKLNLILENRPTWFLGSSIFRVGWGTLIGCAVITLDLVIKFKEYYWQNAMQCTALINVITAWQLGRKDSGRCKQLRRHIGLPVLQTKAL